VFWGKTEGEERGEGGGEEKGSWKGGRRRGSGMRGRRRGECKKKGGRKKKRGDEL
jgi:hypothetical protein